MQTVSGTSPRRLRLLLALARLALWWEQAWPQLWRPVAVAGTFLAVALLDVLPLLPGWLHVAALAGFAVALVATALPVGRLNWPAPGAARRRLERDSGFAHRPLGALEDRLATGEADPVAAVLWRRHLARLAERLPPVGLRLPSPGMAGREPWGLRAGVVLLLTIGLAVGAGDAGPRLGRALSPALGKAGPPVAVEVWIRPPAYTDLPPIFLRAPMPARAAASVPALPAQGAADGITEVPRGSTIVARAWPLGRPPRLEMGDRVHAFAALGGGAGGDAAYAVKAPIEDGDAIVVRDGRRELARWPVRVRADAPPEAAFASPPQPDEAGRFRIGYDARDDYRLATLALFVRPAASEEAAPGDAGAGERLAVPLAEAGDRQRTGGHLFDLADHDWAGRPVSLVLEATDGAGQTGRSAPLEFVLPERAFHHPVARAVIAARRTLLDASEAARWQAAAAVVTAAGNPERFGGDTVVSLALAVAGARLRHDQADLRSVRQLLWQVALRIEEGDVPAARDGLAAAGRALAEALRAGAPAATIERLMAALKDALGRYLDAVAAEARRAGGPAAASEALPLGDLGALFDHADRLIETGAHAAAGRLLDQLMRLITNAQSGPAAARVRRQLREERALLDTLRGIADDQQRLLDEVFRRSGERGQAREREQARAVAGRQRELQDRLREAMGVAERATAGSPPAPLGEADQAMGAAGGALERGAPADAIAGQTAAVDALRRAEGALRRAFAERRAGEGGLVLFGGNGGGGVGADPFGRQPGESGAGFGLGRVDIPDEGEIGRAQAIVEELRRRAGEPHRPSPERAYIERLLRRF